MLGQTIARQERVVNFFFFFLYLVTGHTKQQLECSRDRANLLGVYTQLSLQTW